MLSFCIVIGKVDLQVVADLTKDKAKKNAAVAICSHLTKTKNLEKKWPDQRIK